MSNGDDLMTECTFISDTQFVVTVLEIPLSHSNEMHLWERYSTASKITLPLNELHIIALISYKSLGIITSSQEKKQQNQILIKQCRFKLESQGQMQNNSRLSFLCAMEQRKEKKTCGLDNFREQKPKSVG
ncbi:hypothetical protein DdX_14475 [Ditylenchus destructor]|uniref:Uncharacterized protein n=1 Tax=Ditylenchus destructor TaxID=166010 RepID=A0AAD4MUJ6_9BILA|nr:hypothetical protein DdX_14475 [Ditylenchus destructor]